MSDSSFVGFEKISKYIGLNREEIKHDLSSVYKSVYKNTLLKNSVCNKWGSVENYVDALYWMRFVKKYNQSQIKTVTGGEVFYRQFQNWGWNYNTFDYEECEKRHREHFEHLDEIKDTFNSNDSLFSTERFDCITQNARGKLSKRALAFYEGKSEEELIRQIYYYLYICKLSTRDIAYIMEINVRSVEELIKRFEMKISISETQKRAAQKRDYNRIEVTRRNTVFNASMQDGMFGSHIENTVRTFLSVKLENILLYDYEVIVGLNTRSIISPYEIDIPVILIGKKSGRIIKIAVEVDGERYHSGRRKLNDYEKDDMIADHDWKIVRIPILSDMYEFDDIGIAVDEAVNNIADYIDKYDKLGLSELENADHNARLCPQCGCELVIRKASRGIRAGKEFWGCSNYPRCTFIENI